MYVLLGANGNITSQAARELLQRGKPARVVGRNAGSLEPLRRLGAQLAIGDAQDPAFLARAFQDATAVYVMIPSDYGAPDLHRSQTQVGIAIRDAIDRSSVRRIVNLSSVGADRSAGTGPIVALHEQEQRLDGIPGLDLVHLRPGYFMENHLHAAAAVAALGVYASLEHPDVPVPTVATADIARVVVRELVEPASRGVLHLLAPRRYTFREATRILGRAIGRRNLDYVQAEPAQGQAAMVESGFSPDAARLMAEMAQWISSDALARLPGPVEVMPTTLEAFAVRFRQAFDALPRMAKSAVA